MRFKLRPPLDYEGFRRWQLFYPLLDIPCVPAIPGVYVVYWDDTPVYVGSSSNLAERINKHIRGRAPHEWATPPNGRDVWGKYRGTTKFGDWLMREARLIQRLRPELNMRGVLVSA